MADGEGIEFAILPGPRVMWDMGTVSSTPGGAYSGIRVRGSDYLSYTLGDMLRAMEA